MLMGCLAALCAVCIAPDLNLQELQTRQVPRLEQYIEDRRALGLGILR